MARLATEGRLVSTVDTDRTVAAAGLVLAATSAPVPLIRAEVPRPGAVICDISQPSNVGADVAAARPDLTIVTGGLVDLPGRQDFGVDLGLPRGVVYACTAETLVLAHRLPHVVVSRGDRLDVELVRAIGTDARLLGFALHTPVPDMEGAGHDG